MPTNPISSWNGNLPTDVELDSGVLYIGAIIFAAQDAGLKFDPAKTMRQIAFDGQRSHIVGLDRTVEWKSNITGSIMQVPSTAVPNLEPGAAAGTIAGGPSGATQMVPKIAGQLYVAGDYLSNVRAVWQRGDGSFVQVRFPKALVSKWDKNGKDKDEVKYSITLEARLDMSVSGQLVGNCPFVMEYFAATTP